MLLENVNQHFAYFCLLCNDNNSSMSLLTFVKIDLASIDAMNGQSNIYLTQIEANRKRKSVCVCERERERERVTMATRMNTFSMYVEREVDE